MFDLKKIMIPLLFTGLLGVNPANSHPVSFKDSLSLMSTNTAKSNELLLAYSVTHQFALAQMYLRDSKSEFHISRVNFLVKRWNKTDSQANIYVSGGTGAEKSGSRTGSVHLGQLILDWESRKYYSALEHTYLRRDLTENPLLPSQDLNRTKLRLGFAPFLADFNDLNVWFISQFDYKDESARARGLDIPVDALQFLRFYQKNVLWEIGAGFDGSFAFNFMIHL